MMKSYTKKIDDLIKPVVTVLGFQYVGCEQIPQGGKSLIRLYIEDAKGVTIEDCAKVSRQVNAVLQVENVFPGEYILEVSSPGIERPLFTLAHFQRFIGHKVKIRLNQPLEGQRNFKGKLEKVEVSNQLKGTNNPEDQASKDHNNQIALLTEANTEDITIVLLDDNNVNKVLPYTLIEKANLVVDFDKVGLKR